MNIVTILDETRKNLSIGKKQWMSRIDELKRQIKDANDIYKRDY